MTQFHGTGVAVHQVVKLLRKRLRYVLSDGYGVSSLYKAGFR